MTLHMCSVLSSHILYWSLGKVCIGRILLLCLLISTSIECMEWNKMNEDEGVHCTHLALISFEPTEAALWGLSSRLEERAGVPPNVCSLLVQCAPCCASLLSPVPAPLPPPLLSSHPSPYWRSQRQRAQNQIAELNRREAECHRLSAAAAQAFKAACAELGIQVHE